MSSELLVVSMSPWANCCATSCRRAPLPVAVELRFRPVTANTSANSAREPLKPVVLALAMLLAMTLRSDWAALMPVSAVFRAMMYFLDLRDVDAARASEDLGHLAERDAAHASHLQVGAHVAAAVAHGGHLAGDIGIERTAAVAGGHLVAARRQRVAGIVLAVPAELGEPRTGRVHGHRAHHVAVG